MELYMMSVLRGDPPYNTAVQWHVADAAVSDPSQSQECELSVEHMRFAQRTAECRAS